MICIASIGTDYWQNGRVTASKGGGVYLHRNEDIGGTEDKSNPFCRLSLPGRALCQCRPERRIPKKSETGRSFISGDGNELFAGQDKENLGNFKNVTQELEIFT